MADATVLFVLHESAVGYSLFEVVSFDEIASLVENASSTVTDLSRFSRAIKLKAFTPFASAIEALENANAISEHAMTENLHSFLEMHLPKVKSKKTSSKSTPPFCLGVIDPGLATAIIEGFSSANGTSIVCRSDDTIREIIRGCRFHFDTLIKGLSSSVLENTFVSVKAQLGLGHSYSRSKVKFNPARSDNMIIQSIALLDQLDKDINTFAMRIREWYSWHFPELKDIVKDNIIFARTAAFVQDKATLCTSSSSAASSSDMNGNTASGEGSKLAALSEIVGDGDTASLIVAAAKTSMGMDCSHIDMLNIINFTQRMVKMAEYRKQLQFYLSDKMNVVAPNLSALIGDAVAARLISKAGSLTNLAKAPASTVQILGAEKALFRALKTKGNTPKYGLIYHSTFIGRADAKNKGRISRYLANKCSIATRIDSFSDEPNRLYGERLRDQVEERLKFYETGTAPRRNIDVMEEVSKELKAASSAKVPASSTALLMDIGDVSDDIRRPEKKKKKKEKKRKSVEEYTAEVDVDVKESSKKKKRMSLDEGDNDESADEKAASKKSSKKSKKEKKKSM